MNDVPLALCMFKVPVPCPPVSASHDFQTIPVTVTFPVAHPILSCVGRKCGVDLGPHDNTAGGGGLVVLEAGVVVVVDPREVVDVAPADLAGGDELEPTDTPTAIPIPRAARTATAVATRVPRRTVMKRVLPWTIAGTVLRGQSLIPTRK